MYSVYYYGDYVAKVSADPENGNFQESRAVHVPAIIEFSIPVLWYSEAVFGLSRAAKVAMNFGYRMKLAILARKSQLR